MNQQTRLADRGYVDLNLHIPKRCINVDGVKRALTFTYLEGKDREPTDLPLYRETEHHLVVPREFFSAGQFDFEIVDCRPQAYQRSPVTSRIKLDHTRLNDGTLVPTGETVQREALETLLAARGGILQLACGKGKTIIALEAIARLGVPVLIVVDNTQLLYQWQKSIEEFLEVPGGVGLIQEQTFDWKKWVVMGTYQTLARRAATMPEEVKRWFGAIFWDEAHHVNAPTFSKSADLFYGRRYGLTATPKRDDGLHVIHEFNFGPVFYKDLTQDLKPRIYFMWTGLELNLSDPDVVEATHATNNELHLSKLAGYFGQWRPRLDFILNEVRKTVAEGRKILVLSTSVDELVNMLALWNGNSKLYTEIEVTKEEVGEAIEPEMLEEETYKRLKQHIETLSGHTDLTATDLVLLNQYARAVAAHECYVKVEVLRRKKQREYIQLTLRKDSSAGLMIYKVDAAQRTKMLEEKQVTFAIMKYGREGLDNRALDTAFLCEPIGSQPTLQQTMGRVLRNKEGKKTPVIVVFEDNIGPIMAMCQKMRKHLRSWPVEDGGPFPYDMVNHPRGKR